MIQPFPRLNRQFLPTLAIFVCLLCCGSNGLYAQDNSRTLKEFKEYVSEKIPQLADKQLDAIAKVADENNDGTISNSEFENRMEAIEKVMTEEDSSGTDKKKSLPNAKQVIDNYYKSLGGKAKLAAVKTASFSGSTSMKYKTAGGEGGGKMEGKITLLQSEGKFFMSNSTTTPDGSRTSSTGSDGEVVWNKFRSEGPEILPDDIAEDRMKRYGVIFPALVWEKFKGEISTTGVEKIDGKECYKVEFKSHEDEDIVRFFDTEKGLLVRKEIQFEGQDAGEPRMIRESYKDYKSVDGIMFPHQKIMKQNTMQDGEVEEVTKYKKVQFNKAIDAENFRLPKGIEKK